MKSLKVKEDEKIKILIMTSLMIAVVFISGSIIKIPTLNGFMQPGDCMVLLSGVLLGKKYGTVSASIGMALVDIFAGYLIWAPFTFVIKGLMAFFVAVIIERFKDKTIKVYILAFIIGGIIDLFGYFIANAIMGGLILGASNGFIGSIIYAAMHLLGDTVQVILGIIIAIPLAKFIYAMRKKIFK